MRVRMLLMSAALPLATAVWLTLPVSAATPSASTSPFDAYIASGDASCLELTVNVAGYNFIVEPDVRIPRATSSISEGESGALASPVDPGDSVDALPGLLFPREEGQLASGIDGAVAQTKIPVPVDVGNTVLQALNPFNPHLEYPIEHASAAYPSPSGSPGDQEATYLGAPNASITDPSGLLSVDGTSGDARAGAAYATADAGGSAAVSVPALGVSIGRVASHTTARLGAAAVTDDASCALHDVTIAPPGAQHTLHIGSLAATLHTERSLSGSAATSSRSVQVADVTLDGHNLVAPAGGSITVPPQLQNITLPEPSACTVLPQPQCQTVPPPPASIQSIQLGGTAATDSLGSNGNQETSTLTGATVTVQTTAPVPASIPSGPPPCLTSNPPQIQQCLPVLSPSSPGSNLPITSAPTTYTLQLASLDSSAYGFVAPPVSSLPLGGAFSGGGLGALGGGGLAGGSPGSPGTPGSHPTAVTVSVPGLPGAIRWPVVALAGLLEALLLSSVYLRRRFLLQRGRFAAPPPESFIDLP